MNQLEIAAAIARLSKFKIGVMEAAALFAIHGPTDTATVAERIGANKTTARARLGILRKKQMAISTYNPDGTVTHRLSSYGSRIVNSTLGQP